MDSKVECFAPAIVRMRQFAQFLTDMAFPERKRRGRYYRYLEEENPLERMPRRTRYRYSKNAFDTASLTTLDCADGTKV